MTTHYDPGYCCRFNLHRPIRQSRPEVCVLRQPATNVTACDDQLPSIPHLLLDPNNRRAMLRSPFVARFGHPSNIAHSSKHRSSLAPRPVYTRTWNLYAVPSCGDARPYSGMIRSNSVVRCRGQRSLRVRRYGTATRPSHMVELLRIEPFPRGVVLHE